MRLCVCVCVCVRACMLAFVCVCGGGGVSLCVRTRARAGEQVVNLTVVGPTVSGNEAGSRKCAQINGLHCACASLPCGHRQCRFVTRINETGETCLAT